MPEFESVVVRVDAEQWPECGVEKLTTLVGPHRLHFANDGTPYVIVDSGHPVRLWDGWWVLRSGDQGLTVVSDTAKEFWLRPKR